MLQRVAKAAGIRLCQRWQRKLRSYRNFQNDSCELLAGRARLKRSHATRRFNKRCSEIASSDRRAVYPRRKTRIAFDEPELTARIAHHFQLRATGPTKRLHDLP